MTEDPQTTVQDRVMTVMNDRSGYFLVTPPKTGWAQGFYRCGLFAGEQTSAYSYVDQVRFQIVEPSVAVEVTVYADFFNGNTLVRSKPGRGFPVNVSYFDLPYMLDIKLVDGNRFALVLNGIYGGSDANENAEADIEAIRFRSDFMSLRDRPLFEEMLKKLQQNATAR
jgi:hypothetical protein